MRYSISFDNYVYFNFFIKLYFHFYIRRCYHLLYKYFYGKRGKINNKKSVENYEDLSKDKDYKKNDIKVDKYIRSCTLPTDHNPFMNFLVTDKRDKKACKSYDNPKIKK